MYFFINIILTYSYIYISHIIYFFIYSYSYIYIYHIIYFFIYSLENWLTSQSRIVLCLSLCRYHCPLLNVCSHHMLHILVKSALNFTAILYFMFEKTSLYLAFPLVTFS